MTEPACVNPRGHIVKHSADKLPWCASCGLIFWEFDKSKRRRSKRPGKMQELRLVLAETYGPTCFYCGHDLIVSFGIALSRGQWIATIDHKTPLSRGGGNHFDNLALACRGCNGAKGDLTLGEWRDAGFPKRRTIGIGTFIPVQNRAVTQ